MYLAAVAQFCATNLIAKNRQICIELLEKASKNGAKMIFFPEASDFIAKDSEETLSLTSSISKNPFVNDIKDAAIKRNIWVSMGIHESSHDPQRIYNSHIIINSQGSIIETYRKLHLFDVNIKDGPILLESSTTIHGEQICDPIHTPLGNLGLMICYDLRFPELSLELRKRSADILTFPSAFTIKTGQAHWEVLLRARAIENQSYVIASAQIGQHNEKRASYGHAMIVDPWGTILARCPETDKPSLAFAEIDLDRLKRIRTEIPVLNHRRTDIFN
ncbi:10627_t:CDS:2 [Funneliformis geosporum]|uniref:17137_t:CDS:1 n=1 Tax=Funneliformis geosporum TaxID=1117311 RepID=A0A9W4SIT4_9GLOM|nr:17137_t:CDS:2 [Funneliformis geosporum]CAI2176371.1 10627_t:CDS:2 [Funneliformis geosporum]